MSENTPGGPSRRSRAGAGGTWGSGVAIGLGIGAALGVSMDNIGAGAAIGLAIGIAFGASFESSRRRRGGSAPNEPR